MLPIFEDLETTPGHNRLIGKLCFLAAFLMPGLALSGVVAPWLGWMLTLELVTILIGIVSVAIISLVLTIAAIIYFFALILVWTERVLRYLPDPLQHQLGRC